MMTIESNEILPFQQRALSKEEIASVDTATLRKHLSQALTLTAKTLSYLGEVWSELERRGEDLSALRSGIAQYLPAIAHGQLDAELVVKYAGQRMLLGRLATLPIPEQQAIKESGEVLRVSISDEGAIVSDKISLQNLSAVDMRFIFADGRMRTESEQVELRRKANRLKSNAPPARIHRKVSIDKERKAIIIGNAAAPVSKIIEALSEYLEFDLQGYLDQREDTQKALDSFTGKIK